MAGTQPARGTRDFLPDEVRRREYVVRIVREVYEHYGFAPLETPAFENIETLLGKYGDEGNQLIFKILKRGEQEGSGQADLALRYDLTVPLARVVAQYQNDLPRFFKRYQIQPVWRADRPARGRFREFYQSDIDAVGSTSLVVEGELLAAVTDVMARLGFADFTIRLNDRRALTALLASFGIPPERHAETLVGLDKLDKIGTDGVRNELEERGVAAAAVARCVSFFEQFPKGRAAVAVSLAALVSQIGEDGARPLTELVRLVEGSAAGRHVAIDASLARGLSYYTGAIMEIAVPDLAGSLGGGGRYDNLIGMFLGRNVPACGFSLGLERIIVVMTERSMFPPSLAHGSVDVMVAQWNEAYRHDLLALAAEFRASGLRVDVYPEPDKLGKQFKYASIRNIPFVAIVGDDERLQGRVTIKNLRTSEQHGVARADAARAIRQAIAERSQDPVAADPGARVN
jgi:histidyl-tRNA synthetase